MKYVLGLIGFIILAVLAVVLLASTTGNRTGNNQEGKKVVNLADYIDDGRVSFTTQGEITGREDYREIRVTVSPSERRVQVITGYDGRVERQKAFSNTDEAFDSFMRALSNAGYSLERSVANKDMRGVCPLGKRYTYTLRDSDKNLVNLWSASCSTNQGTFGGNAYLVRRLFQKQIPDYNKFVSGVRL